MSQFIEQKAEEWIIPVIQGHVSVLEHHIGKEVFDLILISRRSRLRAGLRYKRRGIDIDGNCANFVETEQIVTYMVSFWKPVPVFIFLI